MPEVSDVLKATDGEEVSDVPVGDDRQPFRRAMPLPIERL